MPEVDTSNPSESSKTTQPAAQQPTTLPGAASGSSASIETVQEDLQPSTAISRSPDQLSPGNHSSIAHSLRPPRPTHPLCVSLFPPTLRTAHLQSLNDETASSTPMNPFSVLDALAAKGIPEEKPRKVQERCLTWCTQREDSSPFCKMLCLRKRALPPSRDDHLARLKAQHVSQSSRTAAEPKAGESSTAPWRSLFTWTPFANFRRRLEPYSIVYLRGHPDGPLGRYMEELEQDDGYRDFGKVSRGTMSERKQRDDIAMQYMDWEEQGSLLYLPLTSLFKPVLDIPETCNRLFTPTFNFLSMYRKSFTDGTQLRYLQRLREHVESGEVRKFGTSFLHHIEEVNQKARKEREDRLQAQQEAVEKAQNSVESKPEEPESVIVITSKGVERVTQTDRVKRSLERAQKAWGDDHEGKDSGEGGSEKRE